MLVSPILQLQRAAPVEGAPGCSLAWCLQPVSSGHFRACGDCGEVIGGMSSPLLELTERLAQRSQEAAGEGPLWRVGEKCQKEGHTTQMAPSIPLATPEPPWGPPGACGTRNSLLSSPNNNQMSQMENHSPCSLGLSREVGEQPCLVRALLSEDESPFLPPPQKGSWKKLVTRAWSPSLGGYGGSRGLAMTVGC